MILNQKQTTIAYRCPHCGSTVRSMIGVFGLSADMLRLKCPCGESELSVVYTNDKKIRLTVPCFLCPTPHSFLVSSQLFFSSELLAFPCAYSGINICFAGKEDALDGALADSDAELSELLGETSLTDFSHKMSADTGRREDLFSDPQILDIVMYVIRDLEQEGEITCNCPDRHGEYEVDILDDCVRITCKNCRAKADIPAGSTISANAFLHCTHIDLK